MQSIDQDIFKDLLTKLCAAYDKPLGDRFEAYWTGLGSMSVPEFSRVVDQCCGENQPPKMPLPGQVWALLRSMQAAAKADSHANRPNGVPKHDDNILFFANRLLLAHMRAKKGLGSTSEYEPSAELQACLDVKRSMVKEWRGYIAEEDDAATPQEFIRLFFLGINRASTLPPELAHALVDAHIRHASDAPFDKSYATIPPNFL